MENVHAAMVEAAKEITVAVLREDKKLLDHGGIGASAETALNEDIRRVPDLYRAIYAQIQASFQTRAKPAKEAANVN